MLPNFNIAHRQINQQQPPFIIAELSGNHDQDLNKAFAMIDAAAAAGVDAIKLQTYTAETLTLNSQLPDFMIQEEHSLWYGKNLYELYQQAATPWEWQQPLFDYATQLGLIAFSSPFDETAVDFLESINTPCYKVASFELTHHPLLAHIAKTGKPVILSTGMASCSEIYEAITVLQQHGCQHIALLKCTSAYPAPINDANLATIPVLSEQFSTIVGLSDHTLGNIAAITAVALGARIIEKHFVLSRADGGVDAEFSLEPQEMQQLVQSCHQAYEAVGSITYGGGISDQVSKKYRRSIYAQTDISPGELISEVHIKVIRPGFGLEPKYFDQVIGKQAKIAIKRGTAIQWQLLC